MLQHVLAISLTVACLAYIAWQIVGTFRGAKRPIGSCCSKGCDAGEPESTGKPQFLPADLLVRRR